MWVVPLLSALAVGLFALAVWRPRSLLYVFPTAIIFSPEFALLPVGHRQLFVTFADVLTLGLLGAVVRQRRVRIRAVWLVGGGFLALALVSSLVGIVTGTVTSAPLSFFYVAKLAQYLFVGLTISTVVETERDLRRAVAGLSVAMVLGLLTYPFRAGQYRFSLPFTGVQETAVIGAMVVVLFAALLVDSDYYVSRGHGGLLVLVVVSGLVSVFASAGRAGVLGLGAGIAYVAYRQPELTVRRAVPLAGLGMLVTLGLVFFVDISAMQRLENTVVTYATLSFEDAGSLNTRLSKWGGALDLWANNPLLGVGIPVSDWRWLDGWYVRVLVETGVVGLAAWLWFMADTYRHVISTTTVRAYATGVVGVLVVMGVASVFGERYLTINTAMLFWFIVGTGLAVAPGTD